MDDLWPLAAYIPSGVKKRKASPGLCPHSPPHQLLCGGGGAVPSSAVWLLQLGVWLCETWYSNPLWSQSPLFQEIVTWQPHIRQADL